jgi:excinuclease UvrABC helicase subunit UvrB
VRIELFGDEIERMSVIDPLRGTRIEELEKLAVYPASHYVTPKERIVRAIDSIRTSSRSASPSCATRAGSSKRSGSSSARSSISR